MRSLLLATILGSFALTTLASTATSFTPLTASTSYLYPNATSLSHHNSSHIRSWHKSHHVHTTYLNNASTTIAVTYTTTSACDVTSASYGAGCTPCLLKSKSTSTFVVTSSKVVACSGGCRGGRHEPTTAPARCPGGCQEGGHEPASLPTKDTGVKKNENGVLGTTSAPLMASVTGQSCPGPACANAGSPGSALGSGYHGPSFTGGAAANAINTVGATVVLGSGVFALIFL